jgi:ketosteroid isomerase-like protein
MGEHLVQTEVAAVREEATVARDNLELIAELHRRQAEMHAGGPMGPVADLLTDDVVWHLPGESPIAGGHRGWDAVLQHFAAQRELARKTMRIQPGEVVVAGREVVIQLVEGTATLDGEVVGWRTACLYRVERDRVREAWLVPLDLERFDRIWTALDPATS